MYRKFRSVLNLCAIFSAKLGSIVVSVVFLPVFNKLFGAEDFGIITLIISLQTLLITLDLGMSILVGRDAAYETHDKFYNTLKSSEKLIFFIYLILTLFAVVFTFISHDFELTIKVLLACVLFFSLTLQNIYYSSLNGRQEYISNAISQLAASFSRAIITLSVVYYIETSIVA
ncbi:oligosaccharide flippase family protein, partial [Vibrio vulnificus]|nr:oligosaccharide flippase family protein [Vibrio vulnificus]